MDIVTGSTVVLDYIEESFHNAHSVRNDAAHSARERQRIAVLDDAGLVNECMHGSSIAFDELVTRYRSKVLRLISSTLGSDSDIEDVAQDIFVKVYLSLGKFRGDASFSTYLYTVTVNRCRDELRKGKLRRFFSFDEWFSSNGSSSLKQENEQELEGDERRGAVRKAMKRLPSHTQMLLHMREVEELSYKELADIFDVEIGTIKSRLARARERLREELHPYIKDGIMPGDGP